MRMALIGLIATAALATAPAADDEYTPLVTSDDLSQFQLVGFGPETMTIVDKEVRLTGKPDGYFATKDSYKNYSLSFEWKYDRPAAYKEGDKFAGNSGVLLHIAAPHKVWPKCVEVQLENSDAGRIFGTIGGKFTSKVDVAARRKAQKAAIKPVGEWNETKVVCKDGAIACSINGMAVDSGDAADPSEGQIAWQAEGAPIRFRYLKIKKLD